MFGCSLADARPEEPHNQELRKNDTASSTGTSECRYQFLNRGRQLPPRALSTGTVTSTGCRATNQFTFETPDALWIDARAGVLDGQATYRLRIPAVVPAKDFWSAIVYDSDSKAFVCAGPCDTADNVVGLSSFDKPAMKQNGDGSVDLYFGPKAPAGFEKNWVPTAGKNFFLIFRLYGPEKAFFDKSWKMPDVEKVP